MSTVTPATEAAPEASAVVDGPADGTRRIARSRRTARKTRAAAVKAVLVVLLLAFTLFPAFWMLSSAFDAKAGTGGQTLLPREFTFDNFSYVLT